MSSTKRGGARSPHESYPTPPWVLARILDKQVLPVGNWLDAGAGAGALIEATSAHPAYGSKVRWTASEVNAEHASALHLLTGRAPLIGNFCTTPHHQNEEPMAGACAAGVPVKSSRPSAPIAVRIASTSGDYGATPRTCGPKSSCETKASAQAASSTRSPSVGVCSTSPWRSGSGSAWRRVFRLTSQGTSLCGRQTIWCRSPKAAVSTSENHRAGWILFRPCACRATSAKVPLKERLGLLLQEHDVSVDRQFLEVLEAISEAEASVGGLER